MRRQKIRKTMQAYITDADPLRGIASAECNGAHFFVNGAPKGTLLVRRHSDGETIGKIVPEQRGGDVWFGGTRVAEYVFEERNGYLMVPLVDGMPDNNHAEYEHPVDYLLRLATRPA